MVKKRPYRKIIYRRKINILLVQIVNRNLGDSVIADNAEYLVRQALPRLSRQHYVIQRYDIQSEDYTRVQAADLIIFDGGGLIKFRQEEFHIYVPALLECAEQSGIPVFFNSVGVEGYDASDERCRRLAQTLNYECVKGITVRDDFDTLRDNYLGAERVRSVVMSAVTDPAIFTPQVYGIQKEKQSNTIGLGIVRYRIFEDYGLSQITREFQLAMWQGIIQELEARGYRWKLFVNGLRSDYDFALEILEHIGRAQEADLLVPRPLHSSELVEAIASFRGVIACRMHANIIAYALEIPSIGLVWNDKMVFWGERIGYPQRFIKSDQFIPKYLVQCLEDSMAQGVRPCPKEWKDGIQKPLCQFVRTYGRKAWKKRKYQFEQQKVPDWYSRLVATALGGMDMRYTNMNTRKGLVHASENGFRNYEADIRLTNDGKLVCINGWSKGSYEKLGVDPEQYDENGMDYDTFMRCQMYGGYETMDAAQLLQSMQQLYASEDKEWNLILDIGRPKKEALAQIICEFQILLAPKTAYWKEHVWMRLQSRYDVEAVQEAGLPVQVMYYVPPKQKREENNLTLDSIGKYCKKKGIQRVSMPKEALDETVMNYLRKNKLKACVFSLNSYTEVLQAQEMGVDWIATSYLSPVAFMDWYEARYTIVIR